ncbi:uncharacterized protein (DUF2147 family) [Variovorax boronicumulans]|uniref:DUF2147 domain-containing protein n=1 Tax=Variovorax boronicumulans TaxID=436515 RepID=UPI002788B3E0|nr:DUF2147 domain-containing protein [Variovorax boronicumulans]MDP9992565.1 uncharacterized protein (DUF2147 family) [Variovorax boronicumulans]MDQ0002263.1 uncharacterized protein (DUF2147 family) [Variovorax boronicumulans]
MTQPLLHRPGRAFGAALLFATAFAAQAQSSSPSASSDPRGRWVTANGNLEVEVAPCGAALCGTVTKVLANRSMAPGGGDMQAADKRPALGMTLLKDFAPVDASADPTRPPTEWAGQIYNRENGKTYRCNMSVSTAGNAAGELLLHAYVGLPLFGKTQRWVRVASD